ncbi:MAG TPA: hypothetical protein VJZ68_03340 [Nitrososphaera sp.]|nr:hypothetical protein [Nitrososphaera sp.]
MSLSSMFQRPLLIYDDKCYSCAKFAKVASTLSRGWIRVAGHYYSQEAKEAKEMIFPPGYDATKMFWLINKNGAYGARSGLLPVVRQIIAGMFRGGKTSDIAAACEYDSTSMSCYTPTNVFKRLAGLLSHGARFPFE